MPSRLTLANLPVHIMQDDGLNVIGIGSNGRLELGLQAIGGNVFVCGDSTAWFARDDVNGDTLMLSCDAQSPLSHLNALTGGGFYQVGNSAVSGVDSGHLINTQLPAILASNPAADWVYCSIGANDFYHSSYLRNAEYVKANVLRFLRELALAGKRCVFLLGYPRGPGAVGSNNYSSGQQVEQLKYVAWAKANLQAIFPQHIIIDSYWPAANTDGTAAAGWTYDDLHPNTKYARLIAKLIAARMPVINRTIYPRLMSANEYFGAGGATKNILGNVLMTGTDGSTTLPAAWTEAVKSNCTTTYLLKTNPYGAGKQLEITVNFSAAGQIVLQAAETYTASSRITTADKWFPSAVIDFDEPSAGLVKDAYIRGMQTDGTTTRYSFGTWHRTGDASNGGYFEDVQNETQVGVVQVGLNATGHNLQCSLRSTGAGTVIWRIAEPAIWKM